MCSELFRLPVAWGGVPLLGLGVLLAVWFAVWGAALVWRWSRGGFDGDFWGYAQPAAVGAAVIALAPRFAPEGVPIRGYGVMLLLAISAGVAMAVHRARRHGIDADTVLALVFWLFVAGIVGARAFFVIEYWDVRFGGRPPLETLIDVLRFTEGGLVIYGALIGGVIAFAAFAVRRGLPIAGVADILAPCFMVGLSIGRLGCLLNGCCYGGLCDLPWAVTFPPNSPPFMDQLVEGRLHGMELAEVELEEESGRDGTGRLVLRESSGTRDVREIDGNPVRTAADAAAAISSAYVRGEGLRLTLADGQTYSAPPSTRTRSLPVHPTQVYSAINAALLAWFLWEWFPHRRRDGEVALAMFSVYPVTRFLIEVIRTDEADFLGTGFSISQNVSIVVGGLAALAWFALLRTRPGRRLVESVPPAGPSRTAAGSAA